MKSFLAGISRWVHLLLLLAAVLCYASGYIPATTAWPLHFFGLAYPIILIALSVFLIWWIMLRNKLAWLSLLAILAGGPFLAGTIGLSLGTSSQPTKNTFRIVTYNVQGFARHVSDTGEKKAQRLDAFMKIFTQKEVKVFIAQEFIHNDFGKKLLKRMELSGFEYSHDFNKRVLILSKYPIVSSGAVDFNVLTNGTAYADIKIEDRIFRVYNTHLQSIKFDDEDYENLSHGNTQKPGIVRIARKLKRAAILRTGQVKALKKHIRKSPYPVILCGDFNEPPSNYAYQKLSSGMRDAYLCRPFLKSSTYAGPIPGLRIDFILFDNQFRASDYQVERTKLSDHYAVSCDLSF